MGHAAGQLADGFQLLGLAQRRFRLGEGESALLHPLFQGGIELGERRQALAYGGVGAHPLDMRPGTLGDFPDQRQVVGRPDACRLVVHRHQRGQAAILDQREADGRQRAQGLVAGGFLRREFDAVVLHHQRFSGTQLLHGPRAE